MAGNSSQLINRAQEVMAFIFKTSGFGRAFQKVVVTSATETTLAAEFDVTPEMTNLYGMLHGGATATVMDNMSSICQVLTKEVKTSVSVNLSINYLKGAKLGDRLVIESETLKVGKTLAYLGIKLKRKEDGAIIATGTHVKHIGGQ